MTRSLAHLAEPGKGCVASDDEELSDATERGYEVFGDAVGKIFLLGISAHIVEWQYGDGRSVGERKCVVLFGRFLRQASFAQAL